MKPAKFFFKCITLVSIIITLSFSDSNAQAPFARGVNLTNWFQTSDSHQIQFTKYTKQDFENIKSLGCDVVRLPINLHAMTSGAPDYVVDTLFLSFLDQAVNWAEDLEINLIIDNHTFNPSESTDPNIGYILNKVWKQLAVHYKNRSKLIFYEVLNEPHGISDEAWGTIQQDVINTIRQVDTKHTIVVGGSGFNSYNNLGKIPEYTDDNLLYTFHFYDPFVFTHQGASWVTPSMVPLAGVPFPYREQDMPACPESIKGSWIESALNDYPNTGNVEHVKQLIDIAVAFRDSRKVNVFCGEFGVYIPNSNPADRNYWYKEVRSYLEEKNIPWTSWDYHGGFGIFKPNTGGRFNYDLNLPLLEALGLNIPEQQTWIPQPDSTGFPVYTDYIAQHINEAGYANGGTIDYYSAEMPHDGDYALYWAGSEQYGQVGFDFVPDKDLSELKKKIMP
ncbi:MAG TPA: glycoside hydrolase family 5 protein [Bacteroidales bacterium]|nr:glycoside hydrolase family 5 protein [Bacteroidales bacterium]